MRFSILFSKSNHRNNHHKLSHLRTLFDGTFKPVRDRGLDHAVEREKNLKPLINLKNLIKNEPSKSLPLSTISQNRQSLQLPFRPIEFTRKYPSFFQEFQPAGVSAASAGIHPHIRLTPEALAIDADEQIVYQSNGYKDQLANRLLKLLMISRVHKIPLRLIESLKWDLGLPADYVHSVIPEFPDCFRVVQEKNRGFGRNDGDSDRVLELVCWSDELAISVMEKNKKKVGNGNDEMVFPVQFSSGFEKDKRYERWLSQWQKLTYVSPYENAAHLSASSDESDRWVVGVLHEILHILVPKKTEKDILLLIGDWLGLTSRFKRALLQHPGIFYLSSKIGTQTVVLKEGYKRGSLVEDHPLMDLRSQYIHLMNTVKEDSKAGKATVQGKSIPKESDANDLEGGGGGENDEKSGEEDEGERHASSEAEVEDESDDDFDDGQGRPRRGNRKTAVSSWGRQVEKVNLNGKNSLRNSQSERSAGKFNQKTREESKKERHDSSEGEAEDDSEDDFDDDEEQPQRGNRKTAASSWGRQVGKVNLNGKQPLRDSRRERPAGKFNRKTREENKERHASSEAGAEDVSEDDFDDDDEERPQIGNRKTTASSWGRQVGNVNLNGKKPLRDSRRERPAGKFNRKTREEYPSGVSKRTQGRGRNRDDESSVQRSRSSKSRGRSTSKSNPVL